MSELIDALRYQRRSDITDMLAMTYYHQIKARERFPEIMDRREELMGLWLTSYDLRDAAEMILLIVRYDLKGGSLPDDYDAESARESYERMMLAPDAHRYAGALRAMGLRDQRNEGLGREIRVRPS